MNNYIIIEKISSGNFGEVYIGQHKLSNKRVAIKVEPKEYNTLKYETQIYNYLNNVSHIPKLKGFYTDNNNNFLILDLLEYNLKYYKIHKIHKFQNIENILNIIHKLITILKNIHDMGIIHRDIKPENICFKNNEVYLIDFGLAKKIINNEKHICERNINSIIGTPNYISINIVNGIEPSRRDDIESLCYIILYLYLNDHDFSEYCNLNNIDKKYINNILNRIDDVNLNRIINDLLIYCRSISFSTKPNYTYLLNLLIIHQ